MAIKYSQIAVLFGLLVFAFFSYYIVQAQSEDIANQPCEASEVLTLTTEGLECVAITGSDENSVSITSTCTQAGYISGITDNVPKCSTFPACQANQAVTVSTGGIFSCVNITTNTPSSSCLGTDKAIQYSTSGFSCVTVENNLLEPITPPTCTGSGKVLQYSTGPLDVWTKKLKISDNNGGNGKLAIDLDAKDRFGTSVSLDGTTLAVGAYFDNDGGPNQGAVYIFKKNGNSWTKKLKISDNNGGNGKLAIDLYGNDNFGISVSLNGTTLVVGAYGDDDGYTDNGGAVYIFEKENGSWTKKLKISKNGGTGSTICNERGAGSKCLNIDLDINDYFGRSVSLNGTTLAVGAEGDNDGEVDAGAVYLFEKENGSWTKKLKISKNGGTGSTICNKGGTGSKCLNIDLGRYNYFGRSVSLNGTTLAVGAYGDNGDDFDKGAVYLFKKNGNSWTKKLKISDNNQNGETCTSGDTGFKCLNIDLDKYDLFGTSVSLNGTTLAVGASVGDDGGSYTGAVYLFEKENGNWTKKLKISENGGTGSTLCNKGGAGSKCLNIDLDRYDYFGTSVSLNGTTLAVGVYRDDDGGINDGDRNRGAVYLFSGSSSVSERFSCVTVATGTTPPPTCTGTNKAIQYKGSDKVVAISPKVSISLDSGDYFGTSVSLNGTTLAVGASNDADGEGRYTGAVYLFEKENGSWTKKLKISENGGTGSTDCNKGGAGSKCLNIDLDKYDLFGTSVSLNGTTLAVGARLDNDGGTYGTYKGAVYLFKKSGNSWTKDLKISDNGGTGSEICNEGGTGSKCFDVDLDARDYFGSSVSLDGTTLAVGAWGDDEGSSGGYNNRGAVYLFEKENGNWTKKLKISDNNQNGETCTSGDTGFKCLNIDLDKYDRFGHSVALQDNTLAVGVYSDNDNGSGKGAVYIFEKSGNSWTKDLKISDNGGTGSAICEKGGVGSKCVSIELRKTDRFGTSVSLNGTTLAVGAEGDNYGEVDAGAVYLFKKSGNSWTKTLKLSAGEEEVGFICTDIETTKPPRCTNSDKVLQYKISNKVAISLDKYDYFGTSVAQDGTTLAVGAYGDNDNGSGKGAVYLFKKSGGKWTKDLKISDTDGTGSKICNEGGAGSKCLYIGLDSDDYFGSSVALEGNTLVVGAYGDSSYKGAVYLFKKSGNSWTKTLKISDNGGGSGKVDVDLDARDYFGSSVSLDGTTLAVGASGAVYLFEKENGNWTKKLKISKNGGTGSTDCNKGGAGSKCLNINLDGGDSFGISVSLNGTTLAVGATGDADGGTRRGAVYLFKKSGNSWTKDLKISNNDRGTGNLNCTKGDKEFKCLNTDLDDHYFNGDNFGSSVALDGTTLAVGASNDGDGGRSSDNKRGAVYIFEKSGNSWTKKLKISDNNQNGETCTLGDTGFKCLNIDLDAKDYFGSSVALDGDTLAVGATRDGDGGIGKGALYILEKRGNSWTQTTKISENDGGDGEFICADVPVTRKPTFCASYYTGLKYKKTDKWTKTTEVSRVFSYTLNDNELFGRSIAFVEKDNLVVGAQSANNTGVVYSVPKNFGAYNYGVWSKSHKIHNSGLEDDDNFGSSVAQDGTTLAVGAYGDSSYKGAVYIFRKHGIRWTKTLKISDNGGGIGKVDIDLYGNDYFGSSVALEGNTLVVGAYGDDDGGSLAGAVYLFKKSGNSWTKDLKISKNGGTGSTLCNEGGTGSKCLDIDLDFGDRFGNSVALEGNTLVVGAYGDADGGDGAGSVYLFEKENGSWTKTIKISDNNRGTGNLNCTKGDRGFKCLDIDLSWYDYFGSSVALDGTTLAVGARLDDDGGTYKGAVYLFKKSGNSWTKTLKISNNGGTGSEICNEGGTGSKCLDIDLHINDNFGSSVALQNKKLAVGATGDDGFAVYGNAVGAVYLFDREERFFCADILSELEVNCKSAGGTVTKMSGEQAFCKFNRSSCPSGWRQYKNYTTTRSRGCEGINICGKPKDDNGCTTAYHRTFADIGSYTDSRILGKTYVNRLGPDVPVEHVRVGISGGVEWCILRNERRKTFFGIGIGCKTGYDKTCTAIVTSIGCTKD